MIEFFNIKKSSGGGDGSSLNIFTQLEEPTVKKGIWLQKEAEPEHYIYDEEVFIGGEWAADGIYTDIPESFYGKRAVNIGNDIYLLGFGGYDRYGYLATNNYKYNILSNTYTQLTNVPYPRCASVVAIGTDIYILGSEQDNSSYRKYNYKYDTLTDTYTQLTDIPYEFYNGAAVAVGTDIYLLGGSGGAFNNYKYDTLTDTYTQLTNIPYEFYYGAAVAVGTDIYLLGSSIGVYKNYNYKYNTLTDTYTQLTNIPYEFYNSAAVAVGTDIYVFGSGVSAFRKYSRKYNTLTNTWTDLTDIPYNFSEGAAVNVGADIYLFVQTKVQVYVLESKTYQQDNLVVINQGRFNNVGYEIELFSNTKNQTPPKYAFADAWYYTTQGGLETDIPTYYGDGTQWINIKNPPVVASE